MRLRLAGALLLILASNAAALDAVACRGGRFQIVSARRDVTNRAGHVIVVEDGQASIEGLCPPVPAVIRPLARRARVRARWGSCSSPFPSRLRLRAVIGRSCSQMSGVLRRLPTGPRVTFVALRTVCGNGIVEAGEVCDDGDTIDGDCCSGKCQVEAGCCASNLDCAADTQYCEKPRGSCAGAGQCAKRPGACPQLYDPVCGCDGNTYGSACDAAVVGVSVASEGTCGGGETCGTIVGLGCPEGQFCEFPAGSCHSADLGGTCVVISGICIQNYDPVCGCDGISYPNDCVRRGKAAQLDHAGICRD